VDRGPRPRGLSGGRARARLASTVVPVLVGVIVAFAWNMAGSHEAGMPSSPGLAPTVGTAVEQAADQAWASATPSSSTRIPDHRASLPTGSRGPAGIGCRRGSSSRAVRVTSAGSAVQGTPRQARQGGAVSPACSPPQRRLPSAAQAGAAISASTTAWSAQRHGDSPGAGHRPVREAIEDHPTPAP